ncbi:hypothetical protein ScPMuIL_010361 [Solemya velum]
MLSQQEPSHESDSTLHSLVASVTASSKGHTAVIFDDGEQQVRVSYAKLHHVKDKISSALATCHAVGEIIGVAMVPGPYLPSVLLGILSAECAFYYFEPQATEYVLYVIKQAAVRHFLADSTTLSILLNMVKKSDYTLLNNERISCQQNTDVYLLSISGYSVRTCDCEGLAYCITTSGTTGVPKLVHVPHACIVPNITHLRELFAVKETDLMFLASPLTFDPSIVDLFLALSSGATILIVPHVVKLIPARLLDLLCHRHQVTVMQATPTLLSRMGRMLSQSLLGSATSLRVLALGGEKFPSISLLQQWRAPSNTTELFNLYGTTEVSCWACYHKVTKDDIYSERDDIPLGSPLRGTEICVLNSNGSVVNLGEGQLHIGHRERVCCLDGAGSGERGVLIWRATGDCVEVRGDGSVVFVGRNDDQIKRNGRRINLQEIEKAVLNIGLDTVPVLLVDDRLIVCAQSCDQPIAMETKVTNHLTAVLPSHYQPDVILILPSIPVTKHGKLDRTTIMEMAKHKLGHHDDINYGSADSLIRKIWKLLLNKKESTVDDDALFVYCGGDSFQAVKFVDMVEFSSNTTFPLLLDTLLHKPFHHVVEYVTSEMQKSTVRLCDAGGETLHDSETPRSPIHGGSMKNLINSGLFIGQKSIDMSEDKQYTSIIKKMKTEHNNYICQSKYSIEFSEKGKFVFSLRRGNRMRTLSSDHLGQCRNDKCNIASCCSGIEPKSEHDGYTEGSLILRENWKHHTGKCVDASPLICMLPNGDVVVFIGSHSHTFDAVSMDTGKLIWRTELGDRVESSACLSECGGYIVVGCYDCCVYVLEALSGAIWWKFETGGVVKSSPVADTLTALVYVGSHDKHLYALDLTRKVCKCALHLGGGSVFSSPDICPDPHHLYTATLSGTVVAVRPTTCEILWRYECGKPMFSSPVATEAGVGVGCVDGLLYFFSHTGQLVWKFMTGAPVFSSPTVFAVSQQEHLHRADQQANQVLIFGSHDCFVYCTSLRGEFKWRTKLDSSIYSSLYGLCVSSSHVPEDKSQLQNVYCCALNVNSGDLCVVTTTGGHVYLLNLVTGSIICDYELGGEVFSSPVAHNSQIVFGCRDNFVYCLDITKK